MAILHRFYCTAISHGNGDADYESQLWDLGTKYIHDMPLHLSAVWQNSTLIGESSKFPKSWTSEIQIFKLPGYLKKLIISIWMINCVWIIWKLIRKAIIISLIQHFEADFLWKVSLKILNSGLILKTFTHVPYSYKQARKIVNALKCRATSMSAQRGHLKKLSVLFSQLMILFPRHKISFPRHNYLVPMT